jgi:hypothetical protein
MLVSLGVAQLACRIVSPQFVPELATIALVLASIALLTPRTVSSALAVWIPALYGSFAALQLLVKFGTGLVAIGLGVILVLSRPPRARNLVVLTLSFVAALAGLWVASRQSLADLYEWVRNSVEVAIGYSWAQSISAREVRWWIPLGVLLAVIVAGGWVLARVGRRRAIPSLALIAFATWAFTKEGFTRLDAGHVEIAFLGLAAVVVAIPWRAPARVVGLSGLLVAGVFMIAAQGVSAAPSRAWDALGPSGGLIEAARLVRSEVQPSYRDDRLRTAQQNIRVAYRVPSRVVTALRGGEVHANPTAISAAWGYGLRWRPVPVFQTYAAHTAALDDLNSRALLKGGPNKVLWQVDSNPWESPKYMLRLTCNYAASEQSRRWDALTRVANGCGPARFRRQVVAEGGQSVQVPAPREPGDIVAATIDYPLSVSERVAALLLKPPTKPSVVVNGQPIEFVSATASQLHLLRAPRTVRDRAAPNGGLNIHTLAFPNASGAVTLRFYELSVE